jgi:hypothetical protein
MNICKDGVVSHSFVCLWGNDGIEKEGECKMIYMLKTDSYPGREQNQVPRLLVLLPTIHSHSRLALSR